MLESRSKAISAHLWTWVRQKNLAPETAAFDAALESWARAKSDADMLGLLSHYAADFAVDGKPFKDYRQQLQQEVARLAGRALRLADVSVLGWSDDAQVRVVTFAETVTGLRGHRVVRQYWERRGKSWQIVYETALR